MKKFIATILAVIYLATTSGATISMHYCMGKIYSVDLVKKDNCTKCGMKKAKGCCSDEVKIIKVQDTHKLISQQINLKSPFEVIKINYVIFEPAVNDVSPILAANNNSPPGSSGASLCILNCVFRL